MGRTTWQNKSSSSARSDVCIFPSHRGRRIEHTSPLQGFGIKSSQYLPTHRAYRREGKRTAKNMSALTVSLGNQTRGLGILHPACSGNASCIRNHQIGIGRTALGLVSVRFRMPDGQSTILNRSMIALAFPRTR